MAWYFNLDLPEFPVRHAVHRNVAKQVLTAKLNADVLKSLQHIINVVRKERASARLEGEFLENQIAIRLSPFAVKFLARIVGFFRRDPLRARTDCVNLHSSPSQRVNRIALGVRT